MSKNHKKVCTVFSNVKHSLVLVSAVNWCVSVSALSFLVGITMSIASSILGLKICEITALVKK